MAWWQQVRLSMVALAGLVVSVASVADEPFADWNRAFSDAIRKLESGETAAATAILDDLVDAYAWRAGPGGANERNLGTILIHRAVAFQQAGRVEDARWEWDVATCFLPRSDTFDLRRFGEAGSALMAYAQEEPPAGVPSATELENSPGLALEPPRVIRRVSPRYPTGAQQFHAQGAVEAQVLLDEQGVVSRPRLLSKVDHPGLNYAAVQVLREWKFEPATLDGRPVKVLYSLTVKFRLTQDGSPPRFRSGSRPR